MLYVIIGKNRDQTKAKREELISTLTASAKKENIPTTVVSLESTDFQSGSSDAIGNCMQLEQYLGGRGLFGEQYVVNMVDLLKDKNVAVILEDKFSVMNESTNFFIIREEGIDAATKKTLTKMASEVFDLDKSAGKSVEEVEVSGGKNRFKDFNVFTLTDALGSKDRKRAWQTYIQARELGHEPEQIFGTIWWFIKNLRLISAPGSTKDNTALNPFVYSKTKAALANYNQTEINNMSKYLASIYHESHRGKADLAIELEKFVLGKY